MRNVWKAALPMLLAAGLTLGALSANAAPSDAFRDIQGHWAQETLKRAFDDGIMKGTSATAMSPNASITRIQAVTLLCRILQVSGTGDTSGMDIPGDAWYASDAAHGVYLGLLDASDGSTLNDPISRGEAFVLFADAFQNVRALPGQDGLAQFEDGPYLSGETAFAAENLIDSGVVNGIDGKLKADKPLTRAEFVTMLYRIADAFLPASEYTGQGTKGAVLSGSASLEGISGGNLWFDQTASSIRLSDLSASWVVVRSDRLADLTLSGAGTIGTLVLAESQGDVDLTIPDDFRLSTLTAGDGGGSVTVAGPLSAVEVTGDGRTVMINSDPDSLTISGSGNTVTVNNTNGDLSQVTVTGSGNTVVLNGTVKALSLHGRDNTINGSGRAAVTDLFTRHYKLNISSGTVNPWTSYDLSKVRIGLEAPSTLPAGDHLRATAHLTISEGDMGKRCTGAWYLNGEKVQETPVILGSGDPVSDIEVSYTHDLQQKASLEFVLTYENSDGDTFEARDTARLFLETFSDLGLADTVIRLEAPERLAPGETLSVTAPITSPETGKRCTGYWYVDGRQVTTGPVTLGAGTPYLDYRYTYYDGMPSVSEITCKLVYTTEDGRQQELSASAKVEIENYPDNGIAGASMYLTSPPVLAAGETLEVYAHVDNAKAGKVCTGTWYVDGRQVSVQTVTLGEDAPMISQKYTYTEDMKTTSEIKFVLSCTTQDGRMQELTAEKTVTLQNYGYDYYHGPTDQEVLKMVTSTYAGNYTLAWAQNNDYSQEIKTRWVNLQGYSSKTKYLIWVNLTYQRVNIFEGSQGNWTLIRTCLCGSGKPSTPTVKGVFATTYKQNAWSYGSYYCGPVVRFYGGYAFHSRLEYWPMGSGRFYDARIGFPISHGCLRMYDDDIWFIYNNIPNGTTVVVH